MNALRLRKPISRLRGHAVEARVYAENPRKKFLPSTGRLPHVRFPDGVRVDTGVESGGEVTMHYDPMIAKVIAHAATRDDAIDRLNAALGRVRDRRRRTQRGVSAQRAGATMCFRSGRYDTGLIEARGRAR